MNLFLLKQHLWRAWKKHWGLQMASVTVTGLVLLILNFMFLGLTAFHQLTNQWGQGLEMTVYMKEDASASLIEELRKKVEDSQQFDQIRFITKTDATKKFLSALGPDSLDLMSDPKWTSPIPASFELRLTETVAATDRIVSLQGWNNQFRQLPYVEDVFYGQGWVENFSQFLHSARGLVAMIWVLSLSVGLLIVGNCIRLSFWQRRDEIEVLELVGATSRFIRTPFLIEGMVLGILASVLSLLVSYGLHSLLLNWLSDKWSFWRAIQEVPPLQMWYVITNLATGIAFGTIGAWNCVRKLNTGWSAAG